MTEPTVWTVNKILQWTQQYFSGKGLENPRLDAEVLLCDVLDCRRIDFVTCWTAGGSICLCGYSRNCSRRN